MYNILISGYYGFNNIGDDSILTAVVRNLREKLSDIEITVLSQNPQETMEKFGVKACGRKSALTVIRAVRQCDLLISGGGSLLQDVTSKKSILYYLMIMELAQLFGKKFIIYSQGIGPINSKANRRRTAKVLNRAAGIVVRDINSKEVLIEIGVPEERIIVTADPVLRLKKADRAVGAEILQREGFQKSNGDSVVGFAIKSRKLDSSFMDEVCISIERLIREEQAQVVLIPFHYSEDMMVAEEIRNRLGQKGLFAKVCLIRHKYLTNEMLSIIGNMDILVGVRLHALIHAAIMGVPMIGIAYDPKINSFLNSVGMKAMCSVYDFRNDYFMEEYQKTVAHGAEITANVERCVAELIQRLDRNEEMIREIQEAHNGR